MYPRARSSRATGPKMRVPMTSLLLSMSTAAFSSKRMYEPSRRPMFFFVRTITARRTSPFFTRAFGIASDTAKLKWLRRDVARIESVLSEKREATK